MTTLMLLAVMLLTFRLALHQGPVYVTRTIYLLALFATPIWMGRAQGVFMFDFRCAVIVPLFAALLFRSFAGSLRPQILLGDLLVLSLFLSDQSTAIYWNDVTITSPFEGMRVWLWPYLMGRILANSEEDLEAAARLVWFIGLGLGIYAFFESILKVNPVNAFFGKSYFLLEQGEGYRWGIKRAQGPLDHPIHFGMMMALIWPWTIQAAPKMGRWGWLSPVVVAIGAFVTVSRGAWIVGGLVVLAYFFFRFTRFRGWIAMLLLCAGGTVWFAQTEIISSLGQIIGEETRYRSYVTIKGRLYEYSGTLHRKLLSEVYIDALREAGWLGFAAYDNARVPYPPDTDTKFRSIDDYYLIVQLQYGTLGLISLLLVGGCGLAYLARTAWDPGGRLTPLAGGLFGACAGIMLILNTVAFPPGFSGPWLFTMGVATGLERLRRSNWEERARAIRIDPPAGGPLRNLNRPR